MIVSTTPSILWFQKRITRDPARARAASRARVMSAPMVEAMVLAVDLDAEPRLQTSEVEDGETDRHLPPHVQALRTQSTQMQPESRLMARHGPAESAGALVGHD